jgi:hypothetical protein
MMLLFSMSYLTDEQLHLYRKSETWTSFEKRLSYSTSFWTASNESRVDPFSAAMAVIGW